MTGRQWALVILLGILVVTAPQTMAGLFHHVASSFSAFFASLGLH